MKSIHRRTIYMLASSLSLMATFIVLVTASIVYINQPEVPEELLK